MNTEQTQMTRDECQKQSDIMEQDSHKFGQTTAKSADHCSLRCCCPLRCDSFVIILLLQTLWKVSTCIAKPVDFYWVETDEIFQVEQNSCEAVELIGQPEISEPNIVKRSGENSKLKQHKFFSS